jgi:hypothetical protein
MARLALLLTLLTLLPGCAMDPSFRRGLEFGMWSGFLRDVRMMGWRARYQSYYNNPRRYR